MAQLSVTSNDPKIHFHFPKRNIGPLTSDIFKFTGKWHDYLSIHQTNIFFVNIYVAMFVHNVTLCFILTPERSFTMKANNIPNENLRCSADGQIRLSRKPVFRMCRMENQEKWTKFVMKIPRCYGQMMNSLFPLVGIFISHSLHCNNPPHLPKTWPKSISVTVHAMKWNSSEAQLSKSHQTHSSFKLRPIAWNINVRKTNKNEAKKSYVCLSLIVERRQKNTSPKLFACRFCHIHIYRWDLTEG